MSVGETISVFATSTVVTQVILWILNRVAFKNDRRRSEINKLSKIEKDTCRTQMLLLMSDYPNETKELLTLAEHYFKKLKGNFYMETLFMKHLEENNIPTPSWFEKK